MNAETSIHGATYHELNEANASLSSEIAKLQDELARLQKKNPKHFNSSILPADTYTAPLRVVLHESHKSTAEHPEYVVHTQNMRTGELFRGRYFNGRGLEGTAGVSTEQANNMAYAEALKAYAETCDTYRVDPIPSEGIQSIPAGVPRPSHAEWLRDAIANTKALNGQENESDEVHAG